MRKFFNLPLEFKTGPFVFTMAAVWILGFLAGVAI